MATHHRPPTAPGLPAPSRRCAGEPRRSPRSPQTYASPTRLATRCLRVRVVHTIGPLEDLEEVGDLGRAEENRNRRQQLDYQYGPAVGCLRLARALDMCEADTHERRTMSSVFRIGRRTN